MFKKHKLENFAEDSGVTEEKAQTEIKTASKKTRRPMPVALKILLSLVLLAMMSVFFTWFIFWRQNLCDAETALEFMQEKPDLYIYSNIVVFLLMSTIAAVTWKVFFSIGLSFSIFSVITYIHMQKFELRDAPLLPEDFQLADTVGNLVQFVDVWGIVRLVAGVVLVMIGAILLEYYMEKLFGRKSIGRPVKNIVWWKRWDLIPRATFTMLSLTILTYVVSPVIKGEEVEWLEDLEYVVWNVNDNYEDNGFVIGFLYNLGKLEMEPPENYTKEKMDQIAETYRKIKAKDTNRVPLTEAVDDIIVILDETFYDPDVFKARYPHTGGEVAPNLHRIFRENQGGYMYSPEYGGSTANVEFEVQTGLSNFWAGTFPYVKSVSKMSSLLSVASWARQNGFETTGIHSYDGSVYKRDIVYPVLGYNNFIDQTSLKYKEHENQSIYINDRSIFNEAFDIVSENKSKQMIGVATMQNHGPYDSAQYPNLEFRMIWGPNPLLEANFQSLHMADEYVGELLAKLDESEKRTVVLWFGDHAAGILDEYIKSDNEYYQQLAHITPYFVYTNFEVEDLYTDREVVKLNEEAGFEFETKGLSLPVVTPNCLLNTMYNIINAEKPAFYYLVDEVCAENPILARSYFTESGPKETEALLNYELVNYDTLSGKRYWNGE